MTIAPVFDPNEFIRFDKLDMIPEAINPRFKQLMDETNINFRYDPNTPLPVDPTKYGPKSYYMNNKKIKRSGVDVDFTPEMVEELKRCKNDILYFAERYYFIRTLDHGKIKIPLRDYQKFWLRISERTDVRNRAWLACRQSAKSTTLTIEIAHKIMFQKDYEYVILANKGQTAREIFSRVRMAYEQLPLWMQVGVDEWNKGSVTLENDSKVFAAASSSDSIRGFSPNEVLLDEAAFIKNDEEFMASVYPTIASGSKSRITQITTPNGPRGIFYRDYTRAVKGLNNYFSYKVPWFFVPGRDEAWKKNEIENTSLMQFKQEQDCDFLGTADGLIDGQILEEIQIHIEEPMNVNSEELQDPAYRVFEVPKEGHSYIITADTAEGKGQDSSTFTVIDVTEKPYTTALTYKDNQVSPLVFPSKLVKVAELYNKALVIIENNNQSGAITAYSVYHDKEYENTYLGGDGPLDIGVRTTRPVKALGCGALRGLIEKRGLIVKDERTFLELSNFRIQKNGSYAAPEGSHDDLVQNLWLFAWYTATDEFQDAIQENLYQSLYREEMNSIDMMKITSSDDEVDEYDPYNAKQIGNNNASSFW